MLRRARLWHEVTAKYVVAKMLGDAGTGTGVVAQVLAGEPSLVV
jgi:hypothetical protein